MKLQLIHGVNMPARVGEIIAWAITKVGEWPKWQVPLVHLVTNHPESPRGLKGVIRLGEVVFASGNSEVSRVIARAWDKSEPDLRGAALQLVKMILACDDHGNMKGAPLLARDSVEWLNIVTQASAIKDHFADEQADKKASVAAVNFEMAVELVRDLTNNLREARDERDRDNKLALVDGGCALELIDRGEELLKAIKVASARTLFDDILEQLAIRKITAAKFEPVPDRIVVPLSVESLQPKNVLEWVFGNQNDFWEATLMLDSEPLVNIVSEVEDDSESESDIANFIAEVITHHEARIC